jgi:plasmid stability protein
VRAATVKISPRIGAEVARRLRLAASVGSRSMSALVNEVLDEKLPSLEQIRRQLDIAAGAVEGGGADERVR